MPLFSVVVLSMNNMRECSFLKFQSHSFEDFEGGGGGGALPLTFLSFLTLSNLSYLIQSSIL